MHVCLLSVRIADIHIGLCLYGVQAIRVFFLIRSLSFTLRQERETQLPLTRADECVNVDDVLDLSQSKLSAAVTKLPKLNDEIK